MEEDNPVFEGQVGETLTVDGVIYSDVVPLAIDGFPYPRHLVRTDRVKNSRHVLFFCAEAFFNLKLN